MCFHFDTRALAEAHLVANGWRLLKTGRWLSRDKSCLASIHPIPNSAVVAVVAWEM